MKKSILISLILSFSLLLSPNYEASASTKDDGRERTFSIDSLMRNMEVDLRLSYAFFVHHHFEMTGYTKHFPMFELSLQKQTYGKSLWQSYFNFPTIGVTAYYSGFGDVDIFGKAYAVYPFINFPFNKSKTNTFGFRFGVGLGYLTEKFHHTDNYKNTSIGANFNAAISLTFEYERQITDKYKMSVFAGLTHFSNGCSNQPNSGINIVNAGISGSYMIGEPQDYIPREKTKNKFKKIEPEFYAGISLGVKRIEYRQDENTGVYNLELYVMDRISNLGKIGFGFDLVYDATDNIKVIHDYGPDADFTFIEMLKPGIGLAYELMMGEASFLLNFGYHPYGLDMSYGRWYQKLGLKVNMGKYVYGKIALNTHFGVADFIGLGLGIRL